LHCNGLSKIKGVNRLLKKESNRAESLVEEFSKFGADIYAEGDIMIINGLSDVSSFRDILLSSHNDNRNAMALIIEGMMQENRREQKNINGTIKIDEVKCIDKSFPSFIERLQLKRQ